MIWLTLVASCLLAPAASESRAALRSVMRELYDNYSTDICPMCGKNSRDGGELASDSDIKKYRLEQIKHAILEELGLDDFPTHNTRSEPPKIDGTVLKNIFQEPKIEDKSSNEQYLIISKDVWCQVQSLEEMEELTIRMKFELPESLRVEDMRSVTVWLDTRENKGTMSVDKQPMSFFMELLPCGNQTNEHITTFRGFHTFNGDWTQFDAMPVMKSWLDRGLKCYNISLSMRNWSDNYCKIVANPESKPFLKIESMKDPQAQNRLKRSYNCTRSMTQCCRENLYVSFKDIKWDSVIKYPPGYEAYYCRGSCNTPTSRTLSRSGHNTIMQEMAKIDKKYTSCCVPTEFGDLPFVMNETIDVFKQHIFPKSVVKACGCL